MVANILPTDYPTLDTKGQKFKIQRSQNNVTLHIKLKESGMQQHGRK